MMTTSLLILAYSSSGGGMASLPVAIDRGRHGLRYQVMHEQLTLLVIELLAQSRQFDLPILCAVHPETALERLEQHDASSGLFFTGEEDRPAAGVGNTNNPAPSIRQ